MTIEQEIFQNTALSEEKLIGYGFQSEGGRLVFVKPLPEDRMQIRLEYAEGEMRGRVIDLDAEDDYTNFRREGASGYSADIREKFTSLLYDLRDRCGRDTHFAPGQARRIAEALGETYGDKPEFLWERYPTYAVFRPSGCKKWYAMLGTVARASVDHTTNERRIVEVLNLKIDRTQTEAILATRGYYPAYHMNKVTWCSILLDGTLSDEEIMNRLAESREMVLQAKKR